MRRVSLRQNVMYEFVDTDGQRFGALSNNFTEYGRPTRTGFDVRRRYRATSISVPRNQRGACIRPSSQRIYH